MENNHMNESPKVLMFCVGFFGYDKRIAWALEKSGYDVDLFDERPSKSFFAKACVRKNIKIYRHTIYNYIKSILEQNKDVEYKYVLVVKGEAISEKEISLIRTIYPEAKLVLYLWDSVCNIPDCENRMKLYDRVLTFDPADAVKYDIELLSIPYGKEHISFNKVDGYTYDVAFIGTAHSIRPRVVKQVEEICRKNNKKMFTFFYSPHILVYYFNRIFNPNYKWIKRKEVHFQSLSPVETCEIYSKSRCILDIEHPKQKGTTTRPVEMLPMHKKIISTNPQVKNFPFYNESNFCIIDTQEPSISEDFWDKPYEEVSKETIEQYSPKHFVEKLFYGM